MSHITLRPYVSADEDVVVEIWRRTWQRSYPKINFNSRVPWWRSQLRVMSKNGTAIIIAEREGIIGFITVDPATHYIDQMLIETSAQGSRAAQMLMDEAKRLSPAMLTLRVNQDNERAIRFYERNGFVCVAEEKSASSDNMVYFMIFKPSA